MLGRRQFWRHARASQCCLGPEWGILNPRLLGRTTVEVVGRRYCERRGVSRPAHGCAPSCAGGQAPVSVTRSVTNLGGG
ncbi:MAG: hypothetical protein G01um1014106_375 [Parcubacteria group bacterium Gr01-1014_106]|nr:MAG: hypothetical protein G01um1014106_375 [Parcubacteria group bacterium Gr01-1014_106]